MPLPVPVDACVDQARHPQIMQFLDRRNVAKLSKQIAKAEKPNDAQVMPVQHSEVLRRMMRFIRPSKRTGGVEWYAARGQRPMCMSNDWLDSMPPVAGCGTEPALIIVK